MRRFFIFPYSNMIVKLAIGGALSLCHLISVTQVLSGPAGDFLIVRDVCISLHLCFDEAEMQTDVYFS